MSVKTTLAVTVAALLLGGCSTTLDGFGGQQAAVEPSQITPAPSGSVESSAVPPPASTTYGAGAATAAAAVTPRAPETPVALSPPQATAPGGVAYAEPGAARTQLAGAWKFGWDNGQKTCKVTLSTDRGMTGFAANADVDCPNDIFMTKAWDVWGDDIVLQNHLGKVTARLKPMGNGQFDGSTTADGTHITLTRG